MNREERAHQVAMQAISNLQPSLVADTYLKVFNAVMFEKPITVGLQEALDPKPKHSLGDYYPGF